MSKVVNNMDIKADFEERLEQARKSRLSSIQSTRLASEVAIDDTLRRESSRKIVALIKDVGEILSLDDEQLDRRIKATRKSEYGRIPGLINLLASIYAWPISVGGQASDIDSLQEEIIELLQEKGVIIDKELLIDIKETKGYHSFLNDEAELVEGEVPDFEEYSYFILTFADNAGLPLVDNKLSSVKWKAIEAKAYAKAEEEQKLAIEALERHKKLAVA